VTLIIDKSRDGGPAGEKVALRVREVVLPDGERSCILESDGNPSADAASAVRKEAILAW